MAVEAFEGQGGDLVGSVVEAMVGAGHCAECHCELLMDT